MYDEEFSYFAEFMEQIIQGRLGYDSQSIETCTEADTLHIAPAVFITACALLDVHNTL